MQDTIVDKKITFTTKHIVIIVFTAVSIVSGALGAVFAGYLEYKLLHIEFKELKEDFEYEKERWERKFKRLEDEREK